MSGMPFMSDGFGVKVYDGSSGISVVVLKKLMASQGLRDHASMGVISTKLYRILVW